MDNEQATKLFNENCHFIDTLTSKYRSYPNYEDIKQVAYLTSWKALLRYDEESTTKVTTWIQRHVAPALNKYIAKEVYHVKNNEVNIDDVDVEDRVNCIIVLSA